jgi:hypothetical protein
VQGVAADRRHFPRIGTAEPHAERHGRLEGGRCLEAVDLQSLVRRQQASRHSRGRTVPPPELRPLAASQPDMGVGKDRHRIANGGCIEARQRRHDRIAHAEQVVAGIDRRGHAHLLVQRGAAVANLVGVFDVVVNE